MCAQSFNVEDSTQVRNLKITRYFFSPLALLCASDFCWFSFIKRLQITPKCLPAIILAMKFHQEIVTPHTPMPPYPILVILPKKMSPTNVQNITSPTRRETSLLSNYGPSTSGTGPRKQLKRYVYFWNLIILWYIYFYCVCCWI